MSRAMPTLTARTRRSAAFLGGSVLALVLASTMIASPASAAGDQQLDGLQYVALGDSYSAGYGLSPYSTTIPADGCYQAEKNYPHQVAAELGLNLTDVTCSNAVTENITTTPQETGIGGGVAPIQVNALSADTDIVTVTIGGNDLGFALIAASCIALGADGPLMLYGYANNCTQFYQQGGYDVLIDFINVVVAPKLAATFKAIAQKAPNAKVFVIGYPAIAPDAANTPEKGCFTSAIGDGLPPYPTNSYPFTDIDVPYLHKIESALDTAMSEQAAVAGATFIPTIEQTAAHSPCAEKGEAYISGITFKDGLVAPVLPDPLPAPPPDTVPPNQEELAQLGTYLEIGALHPNVPSVAFLKDQVTAAIRNAFLPSQPQPTASQSAAVPADTEPTTGPPALASSGSDEAGGLALAGMLLLLGAGLGAAAIGLRRRVRVRE